MLFHLGLLWMGGNCVMRFEPAAWPWMWQGQQLIAIVAERQRTWSWIAHTWKQRLDLIGQWVHLHSCTSQHRGCKLTGSLHEPFGRRVFFFSAAGLASACPRTTLFILVYTFCLYGLSQSQGGTMPSSIVNRVECCLTQCLARVKPFARK